MSNVKTTLKESEDVLAIEDGMMLDYLSNQPIKDTPQGTGAPAHHPRPVPRIRH